MQAIERWEIDGTKSQLRFSLRHIVVSEIEGQFRDWGGEMTFDPDDISHTRIRVWVDTASVDTGSDERDAHVRSAEFLDCARFPQAEFISSMVAAGRESEARVTGHLRLHGITRSVELNVVGQQTWLDDDGLMRAAYAVEGAIDRQDFGLHWNQDLDFGGVVVGDRVHIHAHVEMVRAADAAFAQGRGDRARSAAARRT